MLILSHALRMALPLVFRNEYLTMSTTSENSEKLAVNPSYGQCEVSNKRVSCPNDASSESSSVVAAAKRPLLTHTKDGKALSEKKLRRLEKNRLSARECRRRKREAAENLERQINLMEAENLRLRLQLQVGEEAEESRIQEQAKLTQELDELLKSGAPETDIHASLEEFKEKHSDYGKSRRSAIEFHLRNIERLLMPTQTTSVVVAAMEAGRQHDGSSSSLLDRAASGGVAVLKVDKKESPASGNTQAESDLSLPFDTINANEKMGRKALFQYLVNYLEITPEQAIALRDSRFVAQELDQCLEKALAVLAELRDRLFQTGEDLEGEFNTVRNTLTPTQAAKFLVWVARNKACIHMLNELWERVYPAQEGSVPSFVDQGGNDDDST